MALLKPIEVKALPEYKLWLRYTNGVSGNVDLSHLVNRGIFKLWNDYEAFENVYIGKQGQIAWSQEIDLCPDALYLTLTGRKLEDVFQGLRALNIEPLA